MARRVERFALQSVARDILPDSRTAKCLRIRAHDSDVQVWKSKKHKTASYGGLQTCGSVWVCPVCGAKVVERRRGEIQQAMAQHRACGGEVHLLTLTVPHTRFDALEGLLERQGKALQGFLRDRKVKEVFKEMGYIGQIRGYETTHGRKGTNNGWHPHFHFLQFVQVKGDAAQLMDWKTRLYLRSGNVLYVLDETAYSDNGAPIEVVAELPYLDMKRPGTLKQFTGVDVAAAGDLNLRFKFDPANPQRATPALRLSGDTRPLPRIPVEVMATNLAIEVSNVSDGLFELAAITIYYENLSGFAT